MSRYIDAVPLLNELQEALGKIMLSGEGGPVADTIEAIMKYIISMPTADVAPVVHAHWIIFKDEQGNWHMKCSKCGQYWSMAQNAKTFKRCLTCGAIMDEELKADVKIY